MKRVILAIAVAALLAPASQLLFGKAHVPAHKEQVCHNDKVIAVGAGAVDGHEGHGDCFIDKRTRIPPLFTGDDCDCD